MLEIGRVRHFAKVRHFCVRALFEGNELPRNDEDEVFEFTQEKTGTSLQIPMHPSLREVLNAWPKKGPRILYGARGKPLTKESMGNYMIDAIKAAGLPERCRMHGLRRVAAVMLVEAGCEIHEIMAITGHKDVKMVQKYTEDFSRRKLAKQAREKQRALRIIKNG